MRFPIRQMQSFTFAFVAHFFEVGSASAAAPADCTGNADEGFAAMVKDRAKSADN